MKSPKKDYKIRKWVVLDSGTREDLLIFLSFYTVVIYHVYTSRSNKCTYKLSIFSGLKRRNFRGLAPFIEWLVPLNALSIQEWMFHSFKINELWFLFKAHFCSRNNGRNYRNLTLYTVPLWIGMGNIVRFVLQKPFMFLDVLKVNDIIRRLQAFKLYSIMVCFYQTFD